MRACVRARELCVLASSALASYLITTALELYKEGELQLLENDLLIGFNVIMTSIVQSPLQRLVDISYS